MPKPPKMYDHAKFAGLRNNAPAMTTGDLEVAQNVDIDDLQRIARRKGHSAALIAGPCHSLWSDGVLALVVQGGNTLLNILPNYATATLRDDLTPGLDLSYTRVGPRVYYSNGVDTGVVEDGRSRSWGLEPPDTQPGVVITGGTLEAGRYLVAVTYLRNNLQESGSSAAMVVTLDAPGGFVLTDLPVSADPDVTHKAVYVSAPNGETLYRVGLAGAADTSFIHAYAPQRHIPLRTQFLAPAPAGQFLDTYNGRVLVAAGDTLYYSEAYSPELFDLRKNYRFDSQITMLVALDTGFYVGTETQVAWLAGASLEEMAYRRRLPYGALRGAFTRCGMDEITDGKNDRRAAVFAAADGICVGQDGGEVVNLTVERFSYPIQERGAALIRKHRGVVQCVVTLRGTEQAVDSYA